MTETKALALVIVGAMVVTTVAMLGLAIVHANQSLIVFSGIIPALVAGHLCSRVVMRYDRPHDARYPKRH